MKTVSCGPSSKILLGQASIFGKTGSPTSVKPPTLNPFRPISQSTTSICLSLALVAGRSLHLPKKSPQQRRRSRWCPTCSTSPFFPLLCLVPKKRLPELTFPITIQTSRYMHAQMYTTAVSGSRPEQRRVDVSGPMCRQIFRS